MAFSTWIDRTRWARNTWAMLAIFILVMANVVDMVSSYVLQSDRLAVALGGPQKAVLVIGWKRPTQRQLR